MMEPCGNKEKAYLIGFKNDKYLKCFVFICISREDRARAFDTVSLEGLIM